MTEQTRIFAIDHTRARDEDRSAPVTLSTEFAVERDGFREVLEHTPAAVDLSRAPLPLIESHDLRQLNIGLVEQLRVEAGKLKGVLRLGNSSRAKEVWEDIKAGIVRNLSVGYAWLEHQEDGDAIRVSRWMPYEASLVAAGADPGAGIYRNKGGNMNTEELNKSRSERRNDNKAVEAERQRVADIMTEARAHDAVDLAEDFIEDGRSLHEFQTALLEHIGHRNKEVRLYDEASGSHDAHFQRELEQYSLRRAILAFVDPEYRRYAGREFEISQELQRSVGKKTRGLLVPFAALGKTHQRDVTYGGTGSNLVGTEHLAGSWIDILRPRSVVLSQQVTPLTGLIGNADIPKKTSGATAYWVNAEDDDITASTPAFDQVTLSPKTVGGLVTYTHRMLVQSDPQIEALLRNDLAATLATALDVKALSGDGTGNTPVGILSTTGITAATYANGGDPDFADIVGMEGDLMLDNADMGALAYVTTPALATTLKTTDVGTDTGIFVWTAGSERGRGVMNGHPAFYSSNVPAGTVVFGNWADLVFGAWGALEILADPYGSNFAKGAVSVRAMMDVDFAVRHPESFTKLTEAAP